MHTGQILLKSSTKRYLINSMFEVRATLPAVSRSSSAET